MTCVSCFSGRVHLVRRSPMAKLNQSANVDALSAPPHKKIIQRRKSLSFKLPKRKRLNEGADLVKAFNAFCCSVLVFVAFGSLVYLIVFACNNEQGDE